MLFRSHGFGPLSTVSFTDNTGKTATIPAGGRGVDLNGDGTIDSEEGCAILQPVAIGLRDCFRQTVVDMMQLAHAIVAGFHGEEAAKKASDEFKLVFRDRQAPTEIPEMRIKWGARPLFTLLTETGLANSRSDAERLIKQGAVELDGQVVNDVKRVVTLNPGDLLPVRVGKKRFLRVVGT